MKKIVLICFLAIIFCSLYGCEAGNSPEDIANTYLNALANFNYDTMDSVSIISYKDLYEPIIKSLAEKSDMTEEEVFERLSNMYEFENKASNISEYIVEFQKYAKKDLTDYYGENASIDVSIISISDLSDDDKSEMLLEASDYYDSQGIVISDLVNFSKINQCKKVDAKVYYKSSDSEKNKTDSFTIYLVEIDKKWKVLNIGANY